MHFFAASRRGKLLAGLGDRDRAVLCLLQHGIRRGLRYCSIEQDGGTKSVSALLSNPAPPPASAGKVSAGRTVDAEQVADRVVVLQPVQPPDRRPAGVLRQTCPARSASACTAPIRSASGVRRSDGCGLPSGGMLRSLSCDSTSRQSFGSRWTDATSANRGQVDALLRLHAAVALAAVGFQKRADVLVKLRRCVGGHGRARKGNHHERGQPTADGASEWSGERNELHLP